MRVDWFRGPLVSRHFVEQVLPRAFAGRLGEASADAGHRRMRRWLAAAHAMLGPASGLRALCDVGAARLFACLGYRLRDVSAVGSDLSSLTGMLAGTLEGSHGVNLRIVIVPWQTRLDQTWRTAIGSVLDRPRSSGSIGRNVGADRTWVDHTWAGQAEQDDHVARAAHAARSGSALASASGEPTRWAFCFNGRRLRLVDIDRPYARRFLEFDLRETLTDPDRSRLLWAFARPAAFAMRAGTGSALVSEIVAACDAHGVGVREALQGGVREALELLCEELARTARREFLRTQARRRSRSQAMVSSTKAKREDSAWSRSIRGASSAGGQMIANASPPPATAAHVVSQGLTLLYRVLFLLFAEARALVPVWHPLYRDSYTIGTLHRQAEHQTPRGLWEALQAISRLAHAGCETDGLTITAFNSQLFSPDDAPLIDRARIDSTVVARILQSLMTTPGARGRGRERITYADLGVEQLGAVYERVLDYGPHLEAATARHLAASARQRRNALTGPARGEHATTDGGTTLSSLPAGSPAQCTTAGMRRVTTLRSSSPLTGPSATEQRISEQRTDETAVSRPAAGVRQRTGALRISVRRKESGTFYTPRSMADYLVRETLAPLTATATADRILSLRVLDPAMGSGAFLVSACRFLAHAYEQALARQDRPLPATDAARAEIRRTIARQCLFGVDLNPMAVQLARLSLWLTTLTTDAPLTFLDHHLRTGDSLIGASLDDLARRRPAWSSSSTQSTRPVRPARPTRSRSTMTRRTSRGRPAADAAMLPLFSGDDTSQLMRAILPARAQLTLADDRPETVHEKERLLASLARDSALASWLTLADLWCASWFWPAATDADAGVHTEIDVEGDAETDGGADTDVEAETYGGIDINAGAAVGAGTDIGARTRAGAGAGNDARRTRADAPARGPIGQPPPTAWAALCDQVLRGSSILPPHVARAWLDRSRAIAARQRFFHWTLEFPEVFFDTSGEPRADGGFDAIVGNPPWNMVRDDARPDVEAVESTPGSRAPVSRFVRESGIYDAIGDAHANSYQLFVDRSLSLLRRDGGRLGLVVPWGLAADHGSARLRRRLLERCDVDTMISFDNRDGLFPIHRSLRFLLFTSTAGRATARVSCRFGERDPAILDRHGLTPAPAPTPTRDAMTHTKAGTNAHTNALTIAPALLRRISGEGLAFPDIRSPECLSLLERMHASWPALTSSEGWGVTFSRELHASDDRRRFDDAAQARARAEARAAPPWSTNHWPVIEGKHLHPFQVRLDEARFVVAPAHRDAVRARVPGVMRHRLAYRDVSSATNRTTLIAAIVPPHAVTTHTLFCLRSPLDLEAQHALCGLMNSFVANYFVRLRVSTHVTIASLDHLPMPAPGPWTGELAALAESLSTTATATATAPTMAATLDAARLQALAARAYGITADEFRHILSTFPLAEREEREAALDAFGRLG